MRIESIPFAQTNYFSKLIIDYLADAQPLRSFYEHQPLPDSFPAAMQLQANRYSHRQTLVNAFRQQADGIVYSDKSEANLQALLAPNTFTVTTGHQLCLFTGPLYFIYKIVSTINLAEVLQKQYPDKKIVPVFWLASEDHDFAEVNQINLFEKKLVWQQSAAGAVGKIPTESLELVLGGLAQLIGSSAQAETLLTLFRQAYLDEHQGNLACATRKIVNTLFGKYGLLILDGDDSTLKRLFAGVMQQDILKQHSFKHIADTSVQLTNLGYKPQLNPREINFFYLSAGSRERIVLEKTASGAVLYKVQNTDLVFSETELIAQLAGQPECFSPNAAMRPLYEEFILPNIAYIGGGAEIAYWMQLKTLFEFYKIPYPVLLLRNSALLIDQSSWQKTEALGFEIKELFKPLQVLIASFVDKHSDQNLSLANFDQAFSELFDALQAKVQQIDVSLSGNVAAEKAKFAKVLKTLEGKLLKAEKQKFDTQVTQINRLKAKLFPAAGLQERHDNIIPYYLQYGDAFIENLKACFNPFSKDFYLIGMDS